MDGYRIDWVRDDDARQDGLPDEGYDVQDRQAIEPCPGLRRQLVAYRQETVRARGSIAHDGHRTRPRRRPDGLENSCSHHLMAVHQALGLPYGPAAQPRDAYRHGQFDSCPYTQGGERLRSAEHRAIRATIWR